MQFIRSSSFIYAHLALEICYNTEIGFIQDSSDAKENVRKWLCRSSVDPRDKLLACGALIVAELRLQVLKETEFTCSAGIAHNKVETEVVLGLKFSIFVFLGGLSCCQGHLTL